MDDTTSPELTLEDSIALLIQQVPIPVRDFILHNLGTKTEELISRYKLHIDQGGILENELLLMLLGQETPVDFVAALEQSGIPADVVKNLTDAINQEVFVKLRAAEAPAPATEPGVSASVPAYIPPAPAYIPPAPPEPVAPLIRPSVSQFSVPSVPMSAPVMPPKQEAPVATSAIAPAVQPVSTFVPATPPRPIVPIPRVAPTPMEPVLPPTPSVPIVPPTPVVPATQTMHVPARTMQRDMKIAQSAPAAQLPAMPATSARPSMIPPVSAPIPTPVVPAPTFTQQETPALQPKPQMPVTTPPPRPQGSDNRDALHAVLKDYGIDPYREPPE